jgi:hypothetical protein
MLDVFIDADVTPFIKCILIKLYMQEPSLKKMNTCVRWSNMVVENWQCDECIFGVFLPLYFT